MALVHNDTHAPAPAPAPLPSKAAKPAETPAPTKPVPQDTAETVDIAKDAIPTVDTRNCGKLAPPYSDEIEGNKFSGKTVCEKEEPEAPAKKAKPRRGKAPAKAPEGTVETNPDDITVEHVPNYDEPNGYEIVGRPKDPSPGARTTEEKSKGSKTRKMVEGHMAESVDKINGEKPTTDMSFDEMNTTAPPMSPRSAVTFGAKVLIGLGHLAQHNRITVAQKPIADAYSAGFAHAYDGTGAGPADYGARHTEKENRAYETGTRAWNSMDRHQREEFRVGQSVKTGIPLDELGGGDVRESLEESWEAQRMGLYRGRDE